MMLLRGRSILLGSISSQVFLILSMAINLAIIPLILKYLSKEEYGVAIILLQLFWYFINFDFGLRNSLSRWFSIHSTITDEGRHSMNEVVSTAFFSYVILGSLLSVIGAISAPGLASLAGIETPDGKQLLTILAVFMGLRFPLLSFDSILFSQQKQSLSNLIVFVSSITNSGIIVLCVINGMGIYSFAYALIISTIIGSALKFFFVKKYFPWLRIRRYLYNSKLIREMISFGFFTTLNAFAFQLIIQSDKLLIGALITPAAVAVYSITAKAPEIIMTLVNKIAENSTPYFINKSATDGEGSLVLPYGKLIKLVTVITISCFWLTISFNKPFIVLWVGEGFYSGTMATLLTTSFFSMFMLTFANTICLYSVGKIKGYSIVSIIQATVSILLSIPLAHKWGLTGILIASNIAAFISFIYIPIKTAKEIKLSWSIYIQGFLLPLIYISVFGILIYISCTWYFNTYQTTLFSFMTIGSLASIGIVTYSCYFLLRDEVSHFIQTSTFNFFRK